MFIINISLSHLSPTSISTKKNGLSPNLSNNKFHQLIMFFPWKFKITLCGFEMPCPVHIPCPCCVVSSWVLLIKWQIHVTYYLIKSVFWPRIMKPIKKDMIKTVEVFLEVNYWIQLKHTLQLLWWSLIKINTPKKKWSLFQTHVDTGAQSYDVKTITVQKKQKYRT